MYTQLTMKKYITIFLLFVLASCNKAPTLFSESEIQGSWIYLGWKEPNMTEFNLTADPNYSHIIKFDNGDFSLGRKGVCCSKGEYFWNDNPAYFTMPFWTETHWDPNLNPWRFENHVSYNPDGEGIVIDQKNEGSLFWSELYRRASKEEELEDEPYEDPCPETIFEITCVNAAPIDVWVQAVITFCYTECCGREAYNDFRLQPDSSETISEVYTFGPKEAYVNLWLVDSIHKQVIIPADSLNIEIFIKITFDGTDYNMEII